MVLDASALVALILREEASASVENRIRSADSLSIGTPSLVEASIVLANRLGADPRPLILRILDQFEIETVVFDDRMKDRAVDAFLLFGKGRHPAGLNILDCMTYGVAAETGSALLFVGEDFANTDLKPA